jgi:hypothetical protein
MMLTYETSIPEIAKMGNIEIDSHVAYMGEVTSRFDRSEKIAHGTIVSWDSEKNLKRRGYRYANIVEFVAYFAQHSGEERIVRCGSETRGGRIPSLTVFYVTDDGESVVELVSALYGEKLSKWVLVVKDEPCGFNKAKRHDDVVESICVSWVFACVIGTIALAVIGKENGLMDILSEWKINPFVLMIGCVIFSWISTWLLAKFLRLFIK